MLSLRDRPPFERSGRFGAHIVVSAGYIPWIRIHFTSQPSAEVARELAKWGYHRLKARPGYVYVSRVASPTIPPILR
jgi:hypothetical protein